MVTVSTISLMRGFSSSALMSKRKLVTAAVKVAVKMQVSVARGLGSLLILIVYFYTTL